MPNGYQGKVLWIDLTSGKSSEEIIPDQIYQQFLSGSGLGAWLLYRDMDVGADPLGSRNILGFVTGLLTGNAALFSGRWMAIAKSPLTNAWGEANCGGTLSPAIKNAGYDGIFLKGRSKEAVYILVADCKVQFLSAEDLWGKDTVETQSILRKRHGKPYAIACIGPAGERLSLMAGIVNDGARIAARCGLGAVMGSKQVKALLVKGTKKVEVSDRATIKKLNEHVNKIVKRRIPLPSGGVVKYAGTLMRWLPFQFALDGWFYKLLLRKWGTCGFNQIGIEMGDTPIKNWKGTYRDFGFSRSESINPDRFIEKQVRRYHCSACPLGCGGILGKDDESDHLHHKPEYETVQAWSSLLLNADTQSLLQINDRLNAAGMDSVSAGTTVAFAMECYEKGIISKQDTGGLDLTWGNTQSILALLELMIRREGIGDLLANGSSRASERLGDLAVDLAMHAGKQELAFHDPRYDPGLALHAVVEPNPGNHTKGAWQFYEMFRLWKQIEGLPRARMVYWKGYKYKAGTQQARMAAACSQYSQVLDGSGLCLFGAFLGSDRFPVFQWLNAATGWNWLPADYMKTGWRIATLKHLFNQREGISHKRSIHPRLIGIPPLTAGSARGRKVDLDGLVSFYWKAMGYDENSGKPTSQCLSELGLESLDGIGKNHA